MIQIVRICEDAFWLVWPPAKYVHARRPDHLRPLSQAIRYSHSCYCCSIVSTRSLQKQLYERFNIEDNAGARWRILCFAERYIRMWIMVLSMYCTDLKHLVHNRLLSEKKIAFRTINVFAVIQDQKRSICSTNSISRYRYQPYNGT